MPARRREIETSVVSSTGTPVSSTATSTCSQPELAGHAGAPSGEAATTNPIGRLPPSPRKMRAGEARLYGRKPRHAPARPKTRMRKRDVALEQGKSPDRHRRDRGERRRRAVHVVDQVEGVDEPDNPDDREREVRRIAREGRSSPGLCSTARSRRGIRRSAAARQRGRRGRRECRAPTARRCKPRSATGARTRRRVAPRRPGSRPAPRLRPGTEWAHRGALYPTGRSWKSVRPATAMAAGVATKAAPRARTKAAIRRASSGKRVLRGQRRRRPLDHALRASASGALWDSITSSKYLFERAGGRQPSSSPILAMSGTRRRMSSKPGLVGLLVGDQPNLGIRTARPPHPLGELENRDLLGAADVEDLPTALFGVHQVGHRANDVLDVAEAAALLTVSVDGDRARRRAPAARRTERPSRSGRSGAARRC